MNRLLLRLTTPGSLQSQGTLALAASRPVAPRVAAPGTLQQEEPRAGLIVPVIPVTSEAGGWSLGYVSYVVPTVRPPSEQQGPSASWGWCRAALQPVSPLILSSCPVLQVLRVSPARSLSAHVAGALVTGTLAVASRLVTLLLFTLFREWPLPSRPAPSAAPDHPLFLWHGLHFPTLPS